MTEPLRILVAGAGLFGREHLDRLVKRADVRVVGVADPNPQALATVQAGHGVAAVFADAREMLRQVPADGAIVATPSASHAPLTLEALSRGIAVLLEKPVAPSPGEARHLAAVARESGRLVLPGHVLRFSKDHQRAIEIVRSGAIGRPLYFSSRRYRDESHATRYSNVDPILMTMIHDIDLALWFAGAPFRSAQAYRRPAGDPRSVTTPTCVTQNGVICELRAAWTFGGDDQPPDKVEIVGDRGNIELEMGRSLVQFAGSRREIGVVAADDPLANEQAHFLECLREPSRKPAVTLEDASNGLLLAQALLESLQTGSRVEIAA